MGVCGLVAPSPLVPATMIQQVTIIMIQPTCFVQEIYTILSHRLPLESSGNERSERKREKDTSIMIMLHLRETTPIGFVQSHREHKNRRIT